MPGTPASDPSRARLPGSPFCALRVRCTCGCRLNYCARVTRVLEMQHDPGNALKAVLGLAEECCIDPVSFQADRQPGMHTVVDPASGLHHQRRLARIRRLRLQVGASHKHVTPRLPPRPPTSHTDPAPSSK